MTGRRPRASRPSRRAGGRGLLAGAPHVALLLALALFAAPSAAARQETPATGSRPATGALRIVSQPGVEVVWEGVPLGETDASGTLRIDNIVAGDYRLELRKSGFFDLARSVTIRSGETTLSLRLKPVERSAPPSAATPRPVSPSVASPSARTEGGASRRAGQPPASRADRSPTGSPSGRGEEMGDPAASPVAAPDPVGTDEPPAALADAPAEDPGTAATASPGRGLIAALLLAGALIASGAGVVVARRRKLEREADRMQAEAEKALAGKRRRRDPLLEQLRRREADLEGAPPAARRGTAPVIDVDFVEVTEAEVTDEEDG